jgi:hypothetical protein
VAGQLDPDFWHAKAEEARILAEDLHDREARRTILQIAMMYSAMALRVQERLSERKAAG